MALFSRAKAKKTEDKVATKSEAPAANAGSQFAHVLQNPRITEKATLASQNSVYIFDVAVSANKKQIKSAIESIYKVKPQKVAIITIRAKAVRNMRTGKSGMSQGGKKAYVYLKKGETITIA